MAAYNYQLYDTLREIIKTSSKPLLTSDLAKEIANRQGETVDKNSWAYKNLLKRINKSCKKLADDNYIQRNECYTPTKTKYYTYQPLTQKENA